MNGISLLRYNESNFKINDMNFMIFFKDILLRKAKNNELVELYNLENQNMEWTKFNGPYFGYQKPSFEEYSNNNF